MRFFQTFTLSVSFVILAPLALHAQGDASRAITGGGISAAGWTGKIDAGEVAAGRSLKDAKFAKDGDAFHVTTGPASPQRNPANTASGNYTVKASFTEPKYMNLNS